MEITNIEQFNDLRKRYLENRSSITKEEMRAIIAFVRQGRMSAAPAPGKKSGSGGKRKSQEIDLASLESAFDF